MRILVTTGPTRAYLDKVRFISNYSTGRVGYEICKTLVQKKHQVALIAGPCEQPFSELKLAQLSKVETHTQMLDATLDLCETFKPDYAIFSAAVLDFAPESIDPGKTSSEEKEWIIKLIPTPKILDEVDRQFPDIKKIGFKLEYAEIPPAEREDFAQNYIRRKKLGALCLNFLPSIRGDEHPAFIFTRDGRSFNVETKSDIAKCIAKLIETN